MNEYCPVCGTTLRKMPPSQKLKYCGRTCMGLDRRAQLSPKTCIVCGEQWQPRDRFQVGNQTCSAGCFAKMVSQRERKKKPRPICEVCGQPFTPKSHLALGKAKRCSRACYGKWRSESREVREHLKAIANKGRAAWTEQSLASYQRKMSGESNPAWKGGVTFKRNKGNYIGPKYVRCPEAFKAMARKDGYVMEHRLVMAQWIGRCLTRTEVVDHRDHNTRNNARSNLQLWPDNGSHKAGEHGRCADGVANRWSPKD